jgi:hypothetical protein
MKRNDSEIRESACRMPVEELLKLQCNANLCEYGGCCVEETTLRSVKNLREKIWGCFESCPPTSSQRRKFIEETLNASYVRSTGKFKFIASGCVEQGVRLVCEAGYLILLGLSTDRNASNCPFQWKMSRKKVMGKIVTSSIKTKIQKNVQLDSAATYIQYIANKLAETSPFAGKENILIVPYYDIKTFYDDYVRDTMRNQDTETNGATSNNGVVSLTTFRRAFIKKGNIKLLGCKGSFHTCEICNNAIDLLHDTSFLFNKIIITIFFINYFVYFLITSFRIKFYGGTKRYN